jgi:hypothetical protein
MDICVISLSSPQTNLPYTSKSAEIKCGASNSNFLNELQKTKPEILAQKMPVHWETCNQVWARESPLTAATWTIGFKRGKCLSESLYAGCNDSTRCARVYGHAGLPSVFAGGCRLQQRRHRGISQRWCGQAEQGEACFVAFLPFVVVTEVQVIPNCFDEKCIDAWGDGPVGTCEYYSA